MSNTLASIQSNASNPKVWVVIGVTVAGIVILAETRKRRIKALREEDFGAFLDRFELLPFPPPPPPAAKQSLSGLTFSISDAFDVKDYITGFGIPQWKKTHEAAEKTAVVVTTLLKNGATCVGKTIMEEMGFGITGENKHYGTPINPLMPSNVPGGSSSGSAVSVGAELVDFALGIDTTGGVRIPASFCGILGFRPSQGTVSSVGVLPNSQSLETVGWLAREPSVLCQFGHALLNLSAVTHKRQRSFIFLFELSDIPNQKSVHIVRKAIENLSGYQTPKHIDVGQHIASNVPSLAEFCEQSGTSQNSASTLKALSSVMLSIQRHEFKTNHEEWSNTCKSFFGPRFSNDVVAALKSRNESIKSLYRVKTEMPATIQSLLKEDGILVIPTVADPLPKLNTKNKDKFLDRNCALSSIASMSGCCQVSEKQYKKSHLGNEWNKPFVGAKKRKRSVTDDSEADEEVEEDNEGDDEAKEDNEGDDEAKEDNEGDEAAEVDDSEPESLLRPKFLYVKGMSYLTKVEDIKNFFKDKGIRVKFVKLLPSERNRGVKTRSAVVKLGSLREIKKAMKFNGHEMQVANQPHPVFMERYRNELITIFVIGFRDFLDDNADEVAVREALMKTFEKYDVRGIFLPENQRFGYLLLDCKKKDSRKAQNSARKSFEAFKKLLRDQSGQNDDGMVPLFSTMSAREANMKPEFLRELGLN